MSFSIEHRHIQISLQRNLYTSESNQDHLNSYSVHETSRKSYRKRLIPRVPVPAPLEAKKPLTKFTETYTLTFGDQAENHKGMQILGKSASSGFTRHDLLVAKKWYEDRGLETELIDLNSFLDEEDADKATSASVLIIRDAVQALTGSSAQMIFI